MITKIDEYFFFGMIVRSLALCLLKIKFINIFFLSDKA